MNSFAYNSTGDDLLKAAESILQGSLQEADIKRVKYDVVIAKLKDGIWDTSYDVKPRTHLEVTDNKTKKSMTIFVEDAAQDELDEAFADIAPALVGLATNLGILAGGLVAPMIINYFKKDPNFTNASKIVSTLANKDSEFKGLMKKVSDFEYKTSLEAKSARKELLTYLQNNVDDSIFSALKGHLYKAAKTQGAIKEADDFYTEGVNDFKSLIGKQVLHGSPGYSTTEVIGKIIPHQTKKGSFEVEFKSGAFDVLSQGELHDVMNGVEVFYKSPHGGRSVIELQEEGIESRKGLKEASRVEATIVLQNGTIRKKEFPTQAAAEDWVKKTKRDEDVRDYKLLAYLSNSMKEGEEDFYSQKMIKNQLNTIVRNSNICLAMIEDDREFPEWAQSEIAVAEDGIVSVTEFMESHTSDGAKLEEAVATPAVTKLIDGIDKLSPTEYLVFLRALSGHAIDTSNAAREVNGVSNGFAWYQVSKHINAAAKAYSARPVQKN